jgi:hypothetical protein
MELVFDVVKLIASFDKDTWYNLYRVDERFYEYARTDAGIREYTELATEYTITNDEYLRETRLFGKFHSINDLPAIIHVNGKQEWYKNGNRHRDGDLPAIMGGDSQEWFKDDRRHRDGDLPAVIFDYGAQYWFKYGRLHRDGDLPACIHSNRCREWYNDGKRHREGDLPAVIQNDGSQEWYKDDELHRDGDLPAIIYTDGSQQWYKNGIRIKQVSYWELAM